MVPVKFINDTLHVLLPLGLGHVEPIGFDRIR